MSVESSADAIILAKSTDMSRIIVHPAIVGECPRIEGVKSTIARPLLKEPVEEGQWIGRDLVLRFRICASEKIPMCGGEHAGLDLLPDVEGWENVEQSQPVDPIGMVESKPVSHTRATVMTDDREAFVA